MVVTRIIPALASLCVMLSGCSSVPYKTVNVPNGCHVNAVAFRDAYLAKQALAKARWARLLIVSYYGTTTLHALCVYEWQNGLEVYDNRSGSWQITRDLSLKESASKLAELLPPAKSGHFE